MGWRLEVSVVRGLELVGPTFVDESRVAIGTVGDISVVRTPGGRYTARARYRDWDGKTRLVEATADTGKAATRTLKQKLTSRALFQPSS